MAWDAETWGGEEAEAVSIPDYANARVGSESSLHYALKQVAIWWLRRTGCWIVADEVPGIYDGARYARASQRFVHVADAVGLRRRYVPKLGNRWTLRVVEVKVSRSDWRSGYATGGHLRYLMTPTGLLRPEEVEPGVGLVEVDLERVEWRDLGHLPGVVLRKKASRERTMRDWDDAEVVEILGGMAARLSLYRLAHNAEFGPYAKRLAIERDDEQ